MAIPADKPVADRTNANERLEDWPVHLRSASYNPTTKAKPKKAKEYRVKGHTFGPASECVRLDSDGIAKWTSENKYELPPQSLRRKRIKFANAKRSDFDSLCSNLPEGCVRANRLTSLDERDWWIVFVEGKRYRLDLAMCLNTPNSLRGAERGWDDRWLQLKLTAFFAELDRQVFGGASCRRHTNRIVALQHADGVGWHAHVQIMTPKRFSQVEFAELAKEVWLGQLGAHTRGPFGRPLFWCEPVIEGHLSYMLADLHQNRVDEENTRLT